MVVLGRCNDVEGNLAPASERGEQGIKWQARDPITPQENDTDHK